MQDVLHPTTVQTYMHIPLPPTIHKQPLNKAWVQAGSNRVQTQRRLDKVMSTKLTNQSIVVNEAFPSLIPE